MLVSLHGLNNQQAVSVSVDNGQDDACFITCFATGLLYVPAGITNVAAALNKCCCTAMRCVQLQLFTMLYYAWLSVSSCMSLP
jgi:hypothetical protein